jgi:hypothetical protein
VDVGATTAVFSQTTEGLSFDYASLGDMLGGYPGWPPSTPSTFSVPGGSVDLALSMRVTGANPNLPFTVELVSPASFVSLAKFQGTTSGVGETPVMVPLELVEGSLAGKTVGGIQFTWDGGDDPINVDFLSLAYKQTSGTGGGDEETTEDGSGGDTSPPPGGGTTGPPADGEVTTLAPAGITSVKLLPPKRTIKAGKNARFVVVVTNNSMQDEEVEVNFTSSDEGILSAPDSVDVLVPGKKKETSKAKTKRFKIVLETDEYDEGAADLTASIGQVTSAPCRVTIKPKKFKEFE